MAQYVLTIYWWEGDAKSIGGEYPFAAADDAGAIFHVRRHLEEQVGVADQAAITDNHGRLIWENGWPCGQGGDRLSSL